MKVLYDGLFALLAFAVLAPAPAHAYLDGATVSIALQALTGAVASILVFGKLYWARFKSILSRPKIDGQD
jgi:hypothetical protein